MLTRTAQGGERPRVIATTDGEIDDRCSMVRFLLYANEWDIEGIIHSSSKHHWKGDGKTPGKTWADEKWLDEQIDAYARCYPNLKRHDPNYPSPEFLRKRAYIGNIALEGDMRRPTPGSDRIAEVLLDDDPRPVWLQAWGGPNTIARALKTIEEKHPDRKAEVTKKALIFLISKQDKTFDEYIVPNWPGIQSIYSTAFRVIAYRAQSLMSKERWAYFDGAWMKRNILEGHGPLCAMYESKSDGAFRSEGDSPAFMHQIDVGLRSVEHPSYGGWGGRFTQIGAEWRSADDDGDQYEDIMRWAKAFQNDWAARADWCATAPPDANHPPIALLKHAVDLDVDPGATVDLSAKGTTDPDGDALSYRWWVYREAGGYWGDATIRGANAEAATVAVPKDASGRTIHVILEVRDDGDPPLTRYRRVILRVSGKPVTAPAGLAPEERDLKTPITKLDGPPAKAGKWAFYRGVNINGPAIVIDGNRWEGDDAVDFSCRNRPLNSPKVRLLPPTDDARATMVHSFRWDREPLVKMTSMPVGDYAVYLYVWEETSPETLTIRLNGKVVARDFDSGPKGAWQRLGPWNATVNQGVIAISSRGGAANFSGIEVWKKVSSNAP